MKKIFYTLLTVSLFQSCSPKIDPTNADAVTQAAITAADSDVPLLESPYFGTLPSLAQRSRAAYDSVSVYSRVSPKASKNKREAAADAWHTSLKRVPEHYKTLMNTEAPKIIGTEIPAKCINGDFSSVTAVIEDFDAISGEIGIKFDATLARDISWGDNGVKIEYLNSDGEIYKKTSSFHKIWADCFTTDGISTVKTVSGNIWSVTLMFEPRELADLAAFQLSYAR